MKSPQRIAVEQMAVTALAIVGVLAAAFGIGALLGIFGGSKEPATERVPPEAISKCQDEIRARLNYPLTADFSWKHEARVDGGQYYVWEDFKAKNAFGVPQSMRGMCIFPPGRSLATPEVSIG